MKGAHKLAHGLVLCQQQREEILADTGHSGRLDIRMNSLEAKLDTIQQDSMSRFDALVSKVDALSSNIAAQSITAGSEAAPLHARIDALDVRMQNIENLLSVLLNRLS